MIEITLIFQGKHIDLVVPGEITFDRLRRLIGAAFAEKGMLLPDDFSLALDDKALAVGGYDFIAAFGVGNGDRLQIMTKS